MPGGGNTLKAENSWWSSRGWKMSLPDEKPKRKWVGDAVSPCWNPRLTESVMRPVSGQSGGQPCRRRHGSHRDNSETDEVAERRLWFSAAFAPILMKWCPFQNKSTTVGTRKTLNMSHDLSQTALGNITSLRFGSAP